MRDVLHSLKAEGIEYVFILDGRDVVFVENRDAILGKFNALYHGRPIFCADVFCQAWPYREGWFYAELQKAKKHYTANINAGMIATGIDSLLDIFDLIEPIREELISGKTRDGVLKRIQQETGSEYIDDDQMLYQLCMIYHPEMFHIDSNKELFTLLSDYPKCSNRFKHDPRRGDAICTASIVHGPVLSFETEWETWWKMRRWTFGE